MLNEEGIPAPSRGPTEAAAADYQLKLAALVWHLEVENSNTLTDYAASARADKQRLSRSAKWKPERNFPHQGAEHEARTSLLPKGVTCASGAMNT